MQASLFTDTIETFYQRKLAKHPNELINDLVSSNILHNRLLDAANYFRNNQENKYTIKLSIYIHKNVWLL